MSIESVMPSSRLILCRPLLLLPPIPLSIRVFSNESTLRMRWPKYLLPKMPGLEEHHSSLDIKKRSTCNNTVTPRKKGLLESYNKSIKKTHLVITSLVSMFTVALNVTSCNSHSKSKRQTLFLFQM